MLELAFVRENLPLIEEKLRQRGLDPVEVLGKFQEVDQRRRQVITEVETLKAQRNAASQEVAVLKKAGKNEEDKKRSAATPSGAPRADLRQLKPIEGEA